MKMTKEIEEFLNLAITEHMGKAYTDWKLKQQTDTEPGKVEEEYEKVIVSLSPEQEEAITKYCDAIFNSGADLQTRIQELNGIISASKAEISEKREQLKNLEDLEKKMQVLKQNQPLIDEYNHFFFQKRREKFYTEHKKAINYYRKCERELKPYRDKKGRLPESRWKKEKEDLRIMIEELKADNQPYQDELAFVKKVQRCADIARRDREMPETDTSGLSEEKREMPEQESKQKSSIHGRLAENQKLIEEEKVKNRQMKKKRSNEISL